MARTTWILPPPALQVARSASRALPERPGCRLPTSLSGASLYSWLLHRPNPFQRGPIRPVAWLAAGVQAAARRGAAAAASFHSTAASLSKSTPHIRFAVREKRADAKSALKNLLLNGSPYQERSNKQMRQQKVGGKSKVRSGSGNNPHSKSKRGQNWRNFDEDDCSDTPCGSFGGKTSFTWYWPRENDDLGSSPSGFQWRDESQSTKSKERVWNESDVDEEEESCRDDLISHRIFLGLPLLGPLKLDHIKSAFRASALKWHPDKHQGSLQAEAEEKFRRCVEAYNALSGAFKSSS